MRADGSTKRLVSPCSVLAFAALTFLNPAALLALAAVAVPLFLHLFNLRQPQTVDFSSLDFVRELQGSAVQRVRIKEWLLLALRMLAIACLVMAFAQPTLTGNLAGVGDSAPTAHALVVDNSLSMEASGEGGTYFEQALRQGREALETVEDGDEVLVWPTARGDAERPTPLSKVSVARENLEELEPQAGASSLSRAIVDAAAAARESSLPRTVVYVASDLQESTLGDSLATTAPEAANVQLLPVETREQDNVAVTDVTVASRIVEAGQPVELEATLVNHGSDPLDDYVASVYLEDERVAQATATLEPGLETTVSFTVTPQTRGWLAGAVETEDDNFPVDNRHHFTLHVPEERRVLLVQGTGQRTEYVDLALSSEMIEDRIAFQTTTLSENELASAELGQYDTVLLVGPTSLSSGEVEALTRYVDRGGGLFLFPSAQAQPSEYNALLDRLNAGSIQGFSGSPSGEQTVASFDRVDLGHPLFEGVFTRNQQDEEATVEQPEIYYTMNLQPSGRAGQTLIELSNGFPFLHEVRHGSGVMLLSAVAPSPEWSDLPVRGLFVPMLYRSVYYLSARSATGGDQLIAGQSGELRVTGVSPDAMLRLVGPNGLEVRPEQRTLFGATLLQTGRSLTEPGIYEVQADTARVRRIAVNIDPAESNLQTASPEDASRTLEQATGAPVRAVGAGGSEDVSETLRTQRAGTEIWNVFLLLALVFLASEMLVASQWRPEVVSS